MKVWQICRHERKPGKRRFLKRQARRARRRVPADETPCENRWRGYST